MRRSILAFTAAIALFFSVVAVAVAETPLNRIFYYSCSGLTCEYQVYIRYGLGFYSIASEEPGVNYTWDFLSDGTSQSGPQVEVYHTYAASGCKTVRLTSTRGAETSTFTLSFPVATSKRC